MKKTYEVPLIEVLEIEIEDAVLQTSTNEIEAFSTDTAW